MNVRLAVRAPRRMRVTPRSRAATSESHAQRVIRAGTAEGGTHDPELLVRLCSVHHGHVHDGRLVIRGAYSAGFVFEHADGSPYGAAAASPAMADAFRRALMALVSMGFRSKEAQHMIDAARAHVGAAASVETITRLALRTQPLFLGTKLREESPVYLRTACA